MSPLLTQVIMVWLRNAVIKYPMMNVWECVYVCVDELGVRRCAACVLHDNPSAFSHLWLICSPIDSRLPLVFTKSLRQFATNLIQSQDTWFNSGTPVLISNSFHLNVFKTYWRCLQERMGSYYRHLSHEHMKLYYRIITLTILRIEVHKTIQMQKKKWFTISILK